MRPDETTGSAFMRKDMG